ncbi:MAG TPA: FapA family protein [Bacillota bacterium]|nr:FapA family protein [Bacillota bacterium]
MPSERLKTIFTIKVSKDAMSATISCTNVKQANDEPFNETDFHDFLRAHNIVFGIDEQAIRRLTQKLTTSHFPMTISNGQQAINGKDGYIVYEVESDEHVKVSPDEKLDFRDIIRIPTVKEGEKLATIIDPDEGTDGINIYGEKVRHKPGKIVKMRPGKNVTYHEADKSFYASAEGQISIDNHLIDVQPVYEVNESLSMKTGNLDFVGSITIRGDVPTGYRVKAGGDVKIYGIVEAAHIEAGGSVFISEGLAGLQKGEIVAGGDVHLGYINQGHVQTEGSLYVEQSIVHSVCVASEQVICKIGSIIGGSITARQLIEAKDVGNRLSTKTSINFTLPVDYFATKEKLLEEKEHHEKRLHQLNMIGDKLKNHKLLNNPKIKAMVKKQKHSLAETNNQLKRVNDQLNELEKKMTTVNRPKLVIRQTLYPQVIVAFGKYKRNFQSEFSYVYVTIEGNEIVTHPN